MVGELAKDLGEQGLWVDQVTTLDPYPIPILSDASMKAWNNVVFWDNYWETTFPVVQGKPITGTANNPGASDQTAPLTFPTVAYPNDAYSALTAVSIRMSTSGIRGP